MGLPDSRRATFLRVILAPPVYLFDPKFKLDGVPVNGDGSDGRPRKGDIDKMHAYRDAIRDAAGERVVRSAAILYPGPPVRYADGIEALSAYPGNEQTLIDKLQMIMITGLSEA